MLVDIFYHIDEFCKIFEKELDKKSLTGSKNVRNRDGKLSLSEKS